MYVNGFRGLKCLGCATTVIGGVGGGSMGCCVTCRTSGCPTRHSVSQIAWSVFCSVLVYTDTMISERFLHYFVQSFIKMCSAFQKILSLAAKPVVVFAPPPASHM